MKHYLHRAGLFRPLLLMLMLLVGSGGGAWAETKTITLTYETFGLTTSYGKKSATVNGIGFTVDQGYKGSGNVIQMNSSKGSGILYNTTAIPGLKSIKVTVASGSKTYTITTGTTEQPTANSQTGTDTQTFNAVSGDTYFQLKVSGASYFTKIEITYEESSSSLTTCDLALDGGNVALNFDLYNNASAQTVSYTTSSTGAVTVSESDYITTVVNETAKTITVTPTAVTSGPQTITVSQAADNTYNAGSATFTVTITDSTPVPTHTATFSVNGNTTTQTFEEGAAIDFPSNPADINGKTFFGWTTTAIDGVASKAPSVATNATMGQSDVTYYAVFAYKTAGTASTVTDVLNQSWTGITGTSYSEWNGKTSNSPAVYAGNNAGSNSSIQLRSNNNNSGIITTTSGGNAKKVTIAWNAATTATRNLSIYGKKSAYSSTSDLYESSTQGTLLGTLGYRGSSDYDSELSISSDYEYIGIRSASGALYLTSVSIDWQSGTSDTYSDYCTTVVAATVERPTIAVVSPFTTSTTATITCETTGATIYYRFSEEGEWQEYSQPLTITATTTIYAKAVKDDNESSVATATATKELVATTVTINAEGITNTNVFNGTAAGTLTATVADATGPLNNATVTWTSSNENVATVANGVVTLVAAGTTTITATFAATEVYAQSSKTYDLTVTNADPNGPGTEDNPYTVAEAIAQITGGNTSTVYVHGIISQISSTSVISGGYLTYYISDDGTTTSQLQVYKGKGLNNAGFTAVSDIAVGDVVTIYGPLLYYNNKTPEINTGNYIISLDRTVTCATPTFDVAAGPVTSGTVVTISSSTDGATIYYTTDGSTPTTSSTQGTTVTITSAITLKAIAVKEGCTNSEVASAEYTIASERCATPTFLVPDGTLLGAMTTLTIECTTPGATIYYVMGKGVSDPTTESNVYDPENKPTITISTTVKAIAVADGYLTSEVASASYTLPYLSPSYPTIAHDATSGSISYTITDPQDDGELTATTTADWLTIGEVGEDAVAFTCTANTAEVARTATVTFVYTYNNGTYTREREVTVTQSKFVLDYATLPFEWKGGVKADLQAITGVTAPGLGSDYNETHDPYLVKLDGDGDYIQVKTDSQPGKVTVGVKMIGGATSSTITVQESSNGSTFTDVETLTISGSQNTVLSLETTESFAAETRYVRLLFTKGSNVGVGPITITKYVAPTPAITPESTIVNLNAALHESEIVNLTYTLIDTNTSAPTVVFCDANGEAATYDWISEVSVADDMLLFTVAANTGNGAPARMAYMKVQGTSTVDGATVSSPIITVTQAAPDYFTITLSETIANCEIYVFNNDDQGESLVNNGDQDPVSSATVLSGTTIGISFFADYGYFNPSLTVTDGDGQPVTLEGPDESEMYTFTLTSNVTIGATAVEGHTVNFFDEDIVNCTISVYTDPANPTTSALEHNDPVAPGSTVYVEATPDDGYGTPTITVLAGDSPVEVNYANGVYSFTADYDVDITATATALSESSYVLTDLADLTENDVFIIVGETGNGTFALSNDKGTSNAPSAVEVTVTNDAITDAADNILWNISGDATNGYTFYPNGDTESWLYCTNTNNGVRVGTNENNVFTVSDGYLLNSATSRYVGIYNSQDWRCYTSITGNSNIKDQYVTFYKLVEDNGKLDPQLAFKLNNEVVTEITADIAGDPFVSPAITFADGFNGTITYESSNPAAATVDAAGIVTLVAVGETTITASFAGNDTYNEGTASYVLTVTNPALITIDLAIVRPEGFLRTAEMGMPLGILSLSATNHTTGEAVGAPASVTWSSDNPDVATVDRDGMVTAQGLPGTVTITATFAGDEVYTAASATYEITLKFEPRITEGPFDLRYGTPLTITQSADPADVESNVRSDGALTITSSETRVVTAEDNVITAQAVGQTTVTLATPETDNFWAASTDPITVSVIEPIMPATGTPTSKLTTTFSTMGYENAADITTVDAGAYTMTFEQGSNQQYAPKYYDVGTAARMYNGNTLTIASDMTITGIEFTFDGSNTTLALVDGQPGTLSDAANSQRTWTGSASSIAFTTTKTNRIKSITVTCEGDCEFAKLNANGYATYSSLYNLDFTDAEANGYSAWAVTALENVEDVITLRFAQINSRVAAGTGVLLKGTPNTTVELPIPDADGASLTQNLLDGVVVPKFVLEDNFYMLKGQTFIRTTEGVVPAHKAVLNAMHLEPFLSSGNVKAFNFVFHDTATGVDSVETLTPGQAAQIFDLGGRRLNKATKGINIVNGKKVLVK